MKGKRAIALIIGLTIMMFIDIFKIMAVQRVEAQHPKPPIEFRALALKPWEFKHAIQPRVEKLAALKGQTSPENNQTRQALERELAILATRAKLLEDDRTTPIRDQVRAKQIEIGKRFAKLDKGPKVTHEWFIREGLRVRTSVLEARAEYFRHVEPLVRGEIITQTVNTDNSGSQRWWRRLPQTVIDKVRRIR